jgi:AraC-like DNA-binding protein
LHEILNQPLDAVHTFSNEINEVNEKLGEEFSFDKMINIVENFLVKKVTLAKEALPIDRIFRLLLAAPGAFNIDKLARMSCLSVRQFERQFLDRLGISPSLFIRQARFNHAYHLKRNNPKMTWTSIAYECGYFDQMHLIRDFKMFSSFTPFHYFKNILPSLIGK